MNNLRALIDFFKSIGVGLLAIIGFLTSIVSFIQSLRSEDTTLWNTLLLCGVSTLWLTCIYVFFKKVSPDRKAGFRSQKIHPSHSFTSQARRIALVGMIGVPVFSFTGYQVWQHIRSLPPDKTIILIANFESLDGQNYGVTERIIEQLRDETAQYPDVQVNALGKSVTAQEGSAIARAIATDHKATIFLWGWYRKAQENVLITAHFEVMQKPNDLRLRREKQELILPAREMDSFQIQTRLSNEMTYLTLLAIGLARLESGDNKNAVSLFSKAIDQKDIPEQLIDPANIYYFRGNAFLNLNSYNRAIDDYTESLKITPENFCTACAYNNRAVAYYSLYKLDPAHSESKLDASLADLIESRKHDDAPAQIHFNIGLAYHNKGDIDNAILSYTEALNRDAGFMDAYYNRSDEFLMRKEYTKAIDDYNVILSREPNNWYFLNHRGVAFARIQNYDRAIDDLNRATFLNKDKAQANETQSAGLISKADFINDISKYSSVIKSDPTNYDAYLKRALLYNRVADYDRAVADLTEAIRLKGDLTEAYHQRGIAHEGNENKGNAIADFSKYLELSQDDAKRNDAKAHLLRLEVAK
jgi:tetratricopeptide (TPR) repeat protein